MINQILKPAKTLGAATLLLGASLALSGCLYLASGFDGVPLDELDTSGSPPVEIALAGPDDVILTVGDTLDIAVEGDDAATDDLRFRIDGERLSIGREDGGMNSDGKALIRVTMPAPRAIALAGSGKLEAEALASTAEISLAESNTATVAEIAADDLEVSVAGSGSLSGRGTVERLDISIAGSGDIDFAAVEAEIVEISIAGSGDVTLASNGSVEASIAGSGDVFVTGSASCKTRSAGSGEVRCRPAVQEPGTGATADADEAAPARK